MSTSDEDSFEQIHSHLQLLGNYLKGDSTINVEHTQIKPQQSHTLDSLIRDRKNAQDYLSSLDIEETDSQFLKCVFSEEERIQFENYLNEEMEKQLFMLKQKQELAQEKAKKVRYIEKHQTPVTTFNYHGINIQVVLQKIQNTSASCLILPYDNLTIKGIKNLTKNKHLGFAIMQRFDEKTIREAEQNQEILTFFAGRNTFKYNNYRWIYLVKKPQYRHMPQFASQQLYSVMNAIFEKACGYKGTESVVFSDFDWPGLTGHTKCQIFFWALMNALYIQIIKRKIYLNKITICCENQPQYFEFTQKLREISDSYIKAGLIEY